MKNLPLWGVLFSLTLGAPAWACVNEYERRPSAPRRARPDPASEFMSQLRDQAYHDQIVAGPAPVDPGSDADFRLRSDYASALIRRGESGKAVEILESIEKVRPGEYQIAANLGTAYELSGDLVKAHRGLRGQGLRALHRGVQGRAGARAEVRQRVRLAGIRPVRFEAAPAGAGGLPGGHPADGPRR